MNEHGAGSPSDEDDPIGDIAVHLAHDLNNVFSVVIGSLGIVLDEYSEERATEHLRGKEVTLSVDVGVGSGQASIWTCDLTHGYIEINAGYRT